MSMAKPVMDQILAHGKVVRGYLGVHIQDFSPEIAKAFNFNQSGGVLIGDVSPNTPAARAGLEEGRRDRQTERADRERLRMTCDCEFRRWRRGPR